MPQRGTRVASRQVGSVSRSLQLLMSLHHMVIFPLVAYYLSRPEPASGKKGPPLLARSAVVASNVKTAWLFLHFASCRFGSENTWAEEGNLRNAGNFCRPGVQAVDTAPASSSCSHDSVAIPWTSRPPMTVPRLEGRSREPQLLSSTRDAA